MLFLLTDSQAALVTHSDQPKPPRSGIEVLLKKALHKRRDQDTAIAWIRSHIGIQGNEKADKRAAYESLLGRVSGHPQTATEEGIRASSKAIRREDRQLGVSESEGATGAGQHSQYTPG